MTEVASESNNSSENSTRFDARLLLDSFTKSLIKSVSDVDFDDVLIREYLVAYNEFVKFLEYLGHVFYFVVVDVKDKIQIMHNYLEKNPDHYETIGKMVKYEQSQNMFVNNGTAYKTTGGSRTILRLHRALIFIYKFLTGLYSADQKAKSSQLCWDAYDSTLAKHHTWIVKNTVKIGVKVLPRRETLLDYMDSDKEELNKYFPLFINKCEKVYDITQKIYEKYEILDLS